MGECHVVRVKFLRFTLGAVSHTQTLESQEPLEVSWQDRAQNTLAIGRQMGQLYTPLCSTQGNPQMITGGTVL